jgi:hypothetical protein
MSTLAQTERASSRGSRVGIVVTALGTLVVIAVVVVLLVLPGSDATTAATHHPATHQPAIERPAVSWPLIQYRGTGAAPSTATAPAAEGHRGAPYPRHVQPPAAAQ